MRCWLNSRGRLDMLTGLLAVATVSMTYIK
jgi:hypothetical protein